MSFRIDPALPLAAEIGRIAVEQIDKAVVDLSGGTPDRHEAIHDARKRFKKLRALLRLVREGHASLVFAENARLRDIARALSATRDRTAMIEALDALEAHYESEIATDAFGPMREALQGRRAAAEETMGDLGTAIERTVADLSLSRTAIEGFTLPGGGAKPKKAARFIAGGYGATYARARAMLKRAGKTGEAEDFHALRRHVKYHGAHLGLLSDLWPEMLKPLRDAADAIAEDLGRDHDYAVLRAEIAADPDGFGEARHREVVLGLMDRRQIELRQSGLVEARRLLAEKPDAAAARIERLYRLAAQAGAGLAEAEPAGLSMG